MIKTEKQLPKTCLMLVDTPINSDQRVKTCMAAYKAQGISVEVVNVKTAPITARTWVLAALPLAWFMVWFTTIWLATSLRLIPRYRYLWRERNISRYGLRSFNLPVMFWYDTSAHLARGVAWARANKSVWQNVAYLHAHDLAALSFSQYLMTKSAHTYLTYDAHELSAFRNRDGISWLSGLLITGIETTSIRRTVKNVISVSPFILAYLRFFAQKAAAFHLILNNFYPKKLISHGNEDNGDKYAVIYIGSIIKGRGLSKLVNLFNNNNKYKIILYSPEDNHRQRHFGKNYEEIHNVCVKYGPYDENIQNDLKSYKYVYGWVGLEDICLSYRYAVPNKIFQYMNYGIDLISDKPIYAMEFLNKYAGEKTHPLTLNTHETGQPSLVLCHIISKPNQAERSRRIDKYTYDQKIHSMLRLH